MNKKRLFYIVFLLFSLFLGLYKDGFVSTMLFYMAILMPVASLGHLLFTFNFFKLLEKVDKSSVVKGDTVVYSYELSNDTQVIFAPIKVKFAESEVLFHDSVLASDDHFVLYPGETKVIEKPVDCHYRGLYYIGIDYLYISDFLGIFTLRFRVSEHQKILVYPLIRELLQFRFNRTVHEDSESIASFEKEHRATFSDIRDYRAGDSMRHIHWKLSAKKDQLMTKEFDGTTNNKTTIFLNVDGLPFEYDKNIVFQDYIVEGSVAIIKSLLTNNASVSLLSHRMSLETVVGHTLNDFELFYETLAQMMFSQSNFMKKLIFGQFDQAIAHSQVVIMTPYITEELASFLEKKVMYRENIIILTVDPTEKTIESCYEEIGLEPLYLLLSKGFSIYKINFQQGACRLEVA